MSHFFISAAHKSSGKTTITLGLCAAFKSKGLRVQPFKKGPDYIDPMWLGKAAEQACHNLDFNTMGKLEIQQLFNKYSTGKDLSIIEGNKGLYDGLDLDGSNSNAALAKLVSAPVILVIDARGMTRGIAPLILGYQAFDKDLQIAGIILNQLGGNRHESKLRAVIEHYTDVPVVGAVHHDDSLEIVERHLGLVPSNEAPQAQKRITEVGNHIAQQVDLDALLAIAKKAGSVDTTSEKIETKQPYKISRPLRIGIARDSAFGFYYPGDLQAFEEAGAELVFFDTTKDVALPSVDGIFIGGGFPETQMESLEKNQTMRDSIRAAIDNGMPAYAECGGLMYLTNAINWNGSRCEMVGAINAVTIMHKKPKGRGYVKLTETSNHPWPHADSNTGLNNEISAHEFHYSSLDLAKTATYAYSVKRGTGIDGAHDGIVYKNLLGCYAHLRDVNSNHWVQRFLQFVEQCKTYAK